MSALESRTVAVHGLAEVVNRTSVIGADSFGGANWSVTFALSRTTCVEPARGAAAITKKETVSGAVSGGPARRWTRTEACPDEPVVPEVNWYGRDARASRTLTSTPETGCPAWSTTVV